MLGAGMRMATETQRHRVGHDDPRSDTKSHQGLGVFEFVPLRVSSWMIPSVLCVSVPLWLLFVSGCGGNLPRISDNATIMVWRVLPGHGIRTNTRLVTADLRDERAPFLALYRDTRRVGTCDALELEGRIKATSFLIVQFGGPGRALTELHLLKGGDGQPITTGHGAIDVYAKGPTCPEYRYRLSDVKALDEWLSRQPPPVETPPEREPPPPLVWPLFPKPPT